MSAIIPAMRPDDLADDLTIETLAVVNRLLPPPDGRGQAPARGAESESALAPSVLTALGDDAAARLNQLGREERAG